MKQALRAIAPVLDLDASALCDLGEGRMASRKRSMSSTVSRNSTRDYHGMAVNAYLVWDPAKRVRQPSIPAPIAAKWCDLANRQN